MNNLKIIALPKKCFSVYTLQDLYTNGLLKDHHDAFTYIQTYYYEIAAGMYYFYDYSKDTFEFKSDKDFRKEVLDKIDDKIINQKIKRNAKIFKVICKIGQPRIFSEDNDYFINESGSFLHQTYKPYNEYSTDIKDKVEMILDMIKIISCDNNEEMFKATMKYYGQIARGNKTEVILCKKTSSQGVGKSTEPEFFMSYVFGLRVSLLMPSSLEPLLTQFNKSLMGKLFVIIEDLQDLSPSEWKKTTAKLKTLTTEKYCFYRDVFEKGVQAENISNFLITSNHTIGDTQGRRIISQDISLCKKGDTEYFGNIRKKCFNNKVGEAVFSYLLTYITDDECNKFYGQRDFPETENKRMAIAATLSSPYKYLKLNYVLKNVGVDKIKRKDFYNEYVAYCTENQMIKTGLMEFYRKLEEINIKSYSSNGYDYFKIDFETLKTISQKEKWICKYDDIEQNDDEINEDNALEFGIEDKDLIIKQQTNEIAELKQLIESLQKKKPKKVKTKIKETIENESDDELEKELNKLS